MIFHAKRVLQKKNYRIDCTALIKCIKIGLKNNMGRKGAASKYNIVMYHCMLVRIVLEAGKNRVKHFSSATQRSLGTRSTFYSSQKRPDVFLPFSMPERFHLRN